MKYRRFFLKASILNSYLFTEALTNIGICTLVFTFTAFMSQIFELTEMVISSELSMRNTIMLVVYFVPSLIQFVIPLSLLMGVLLTLGRMSSDGEMIALKASGISLARLLRPLLVIFLLTYAITAAFAVYLSPRASYALKRLVYNIARSRAELGLKERIFNTNFSGLMIYVDNIPSHGRHVKGILISDTRQSASPATVVAKDGFLVSYPDKLELALHLKNGSIHRLDHKTGDYQFINFDTYILNLDLQQSVISRESEKKEKKELSTFELLSQAAKPENEKEHFPFLVEFHSRFAIPFACIFFGLVAVPLGVYAPRTGRSYGFVIGLIVIVLYYILFSFGRNVGSTGVIPPCVAIWTPNLLFFGIALYLFRKGQHESSIALLDHLAHAIESVRTKIRQLLEGSTRKDGDYQNVLVDLNSDDPPMLALKLGISEELAGSIVGYRHRHGAFKSLDDLCRIQGINRRVLEQILENTTC